MQLFTLLAIHSILGYSIAVSLDLGTLFKFGIPALLMLGNMLVAPLVSKSAYRIDWNPSEPPLGEDVQSFVLEIFQMHGKAPPEDLASLIGKAGSLPVALGVVHQDAPQVQITRAPNGSAGLVISTGFRNLTPMQQKAALAHELFYLLESKKSFLTNALMMMPTVLFTAYRFVNSNPNGNFFQKYAAQLLYGGYRASLALTAWSLRSRVLKADAFASEMTDDPGALAEAILEISLGLSRLPEATEPLSSPMDVADIDQARTMAEEAEDLGDTSPQGLIRALTWERSNLAAYLFEFFSHHPLPSRRIDALAKKCIATGRDFPFQIERDPGGLRVMGLVAEVIARAAPWVGGLLGYLYGKHIGWPSDIPYLIGTGLTVGLAVSGILWYRPFSFYRNSTTRELLEDLEVSDAHPIAARIEGRIVGRQQAGYAFGADLKFKDKTGGLTLQYKQPVPLLDSAFAYYEADLLHGRPVKVEGWFRRNPEPYLEVRRITLQDDGRVFGCYRFLWQWAMVLGAAWISHWLYLNF